MFIEKMLAGENPMIFGDGENTRDFIYVLDLADFIIESIDKNPEHKLFHLANGKQISVNEICRILKENSGRYVKFENIEKIKGEVKDIVLDIKLARDELGWEPRTGIEEGLRETWEWFMKEFENKNV